MKQNSVSACRHPAYFAAVREWRSFYWITSIGNDRFDRTEIDLIDKPKIGKHPDVFFYQVSGPDQFGLFLSRLYFCESLNVYCSFFPRRDPRPTLLPVELISRGVRTTLTLGEKRYHLN